jgi:hypothetical protein
MSWKWRWPRRRKALDRSEEALEYLRQLQENDEEIARLAAELGEAKRRNHFSLMVDAAISRRARREGT